MAENAEKTAAVVVGELANAYAQGKIATVVSSKVAISARFKIETHHLDKNDTEDDGSCDDDVAG